MPRPETSHPHAEAVRLQAFLAHSGVASRRAAEELIASGRVFVNGSSVTAPGTKIRPGVDHVEVEGQPVEVQPVTWIALNKPKGYVTTRLDPYGRKTVYELLPERYHGLFHVGRLDRDSEGLLLLTNDGELANRMLHPSFGVTKEYWADVEGKPTAEEMHRLTEGVEDEGATMRAESVRRLHQTGDNQHRLSVVMREGKKREVRRMLEALGHPVARLIRRRFGPVAIGELKPGKWRVVAESELAAVRKGKRPNARLHSGEDEAVAATDRGGERRPQRKPKPDERAPRTGKKADDRSGAGKSAAASSRPRPSELRAKARDEAHRKRRDEAKPRRTAQERDERPYQERGPVKRGSVKRGPVKRGEAAERAPASSRSPTPRRREDEQGPSPRDASRGFPKSRGKSADGPRGKPAPPPPTREEGDREMETSYPSTRRGSARPSPRGGAPDEDRAIPGRHGEHGRHGSRGRRGRQGPGDDATPQGRPRDGDSPRPRARDEESAPRNRPVRRGDGPPRGRDREEVPPGRSSDRGGRPRSRDDEGSAPRGKGSEGPKRGPGGKPGGGPRRPGGPKGRGVPPGGKGGGSPRGRR